MRNLHDEPSSLYIVAGSKGGQHLAHDNIQSRYVAVNKGRGHRTKGTEGKGGSDEDRTWHV